MRYPVMRLQSLDFASGTPFETHLVQSPGKAEQVLPEELTAVVREALVGVAKNGTAKPDLGQFRVGRSGAARYRRQQDRNRRSPIRGLAAAGVWYRRE